MNWLVRKLLSLFGDLRSHELVEHEIEHRAVIRRADRLLREYRRAEEARRHR